MEQTPKQAFISNLVDNEQVLANMIQEGVADEEITATKGFDQAQIDTMRSRLAEFDVEPAEEAEETQTETADTEKVNDAAATGEQVPDATEGEKTEGDTSATTEGEQSSEVAADESAAQPAAAPAEATESGDSAASGETADTANTESTEETKQGEAAA